MLVVISAGMNKLGKWFTFAIYAFIKFWKLLLMFLNLMNFTISNRSLSSASSFLISAGQFFITFDHITNHEKVCFPSHTFNTLSILSISFNWKDGFNGIGIFFKD